MRERLLKAAPIPADLNSYHGLTFIKIDDIIYAVHYSGGIIITMFRKVISGAAAAAICLSLMTMMPMNTSAEELYTYDDLNYYFLEDGTIEITDCSDSAVTVDIPSEINGTAVTSIGYMAFFNCCSLTEVTIPDSITNVEGSAFQNCEALNSITIPDSITSISDDMFFACNSLTEITIPDSVTSIGNRAFSNCASLASVTIPASVTSIGGGAFYTCPSLTEIYIPSSVSSIERSAFKNCQSLTGINVDSGNQYYSSVEGVLFDKQQTTLITYSKGMTKESYAIPEGVTRIENDAFDYCTKLHEITIPDSVTYIGDYAFYYCYNLTEIVLPDSVKSIGMSAFEYCFGIKTLTMSDSLTDIGASAFKNCHGLSKVTVPESVSSIGNNAFYSCVGLTSVTIENPYCEIFDSENVIPDTAVIHGYSGSTAESYANTYGRTFSALGVRVSTGDPTGDGNVDLEDAVAILDCYAKTAAGLTTNMNALQISAADLNGDGVLDLSDAVYVLTYYAQNAAGMNPSWEDIIGA